MNKRGFTLIELMVVMAILAILLGIGAGTFTSSMKKGRDATRKANLRAITNTLELYYNDKGKYPVGESGGIKGCGTDTVRTVCAVNGAFQDATPTVPTLYMAQLPTDPVSSLKYYYVSATGTQYQIYAHLENSQDPGIITPLASPTDCGGTCNWGLSSANTSP
ncbi:MAG: prepilin-type N-terminal cleavage/methylation domain-containing protein [Candidatus Gottesmanbacteria bacterium]|nr:prepilin-type N-terminal cleavage/methylation domain-containing protein [Candidatus Gottesmanbacteria bacterium]